MENRFISIFSMFATVALFIITVFLGFFSFYLNFKNPIGWLAITLFIGTFIAFIKCLYNLNKLRDLSALEYTSEDLINGNIKNKYAKLTTCPDYWTKNVVIDPDTKSPVIMCYNEHVNDQDVSYLGGEMTYTGSDELPVPLDSGAAPRSTDEDVNPENFLFSADSPFAGKNLKEVRDMLVPESIIKSANDSSTEVTEGFTLFRRGDPEYSDYLHTHANVRRVIDGAVTPGRGVDENNIDRGHTHERNYGIGYHSHDAGHEDAQGAINDMSDEKYIARFNNFTNWISPYMRENGKFAIEINLNQLNKAANTCDLAKNFIWSDVWNNCSK